ncbi:hypothetical protein DL93DRAFT_2063626 [Clavulina sp. PMI_390]|nr:hypothetical protein DL93DRAFT_2063626 [Clavulina sp. PMI_390]
MTPTPPKVILPSPRSSSSSAWGPAIKKNPLYFGIPFLATMVVGSFALSTFTQTRYDLRDAKVSQMSKEEEIGLKQGRRQMDIREEYFRLESKNAEDNWEPVRVPRPAGTPEWGVIPPNSR